MSTWKQCDMRSAKAKVVKNPDMNANANDRLTCYHDAMQKKFPKHVKPCNECPLEPKWFHIHIMKFQPYKQNWTSTVKVQGGHSLHNRNISYKYILHIDDHKRKYRYIYIYKYLFNKTFFSINSLLISAHLILFLFALLYNWNQSDQDGYPNWSMDMNSPLRKLLIN